MSYIFRSFFLAYIAIQLVLANNVSYTEIVLILIIAASTLYREKFCNRLLLVVLETMLITYGTYINTDFSLLYGLTAYDFTEKKLYIGIAVVLIAGMHFFKPHEFIIYALVILLCVYYAHVKGYLEKKEELYRKSYDSERQYRYELEQTKVKLLASSKEIAHITEVKERNRIAREIHDNVGHSIAGVLMQLQAVAKLRRMDEMKSDELLKSSIDNLANTLEVLRNTVHNIKPRENLEVDYIKTIINNFIYCPVSFKYNGSITTLPSEYIEVLYTNIKEALTNVSKYSKATKVDISIDVYDKFVRLYIKDDGVGCKIIKEGLGISGMRERIYNIGGSISISSNKGFLIVCILPLSK